jgi:signal peptidase I
MSNDPAGPDESAGHPQQPEREAAESPTPPPGSGAAPSEPFARPEPSRFDWAAPPAEQPRPALDPAELARLTPTTEPEAAPEIAPADPYLDVPAALELAYTPADIGLSEGAFEQTYPYEQIARRRRRESGTRYRRVGRELVETVILALLIFFAVKSVVQNFRVEGASMEPSMHNNEYLLVNKALYFRVDLSRVHDFLPFVPDDNGEERHLFRPPHRGDVVVFKFPLDPTRDFIKRVIGVPGDTVEVHDEKVFINGSPLTENYILATPNYTFGPKTVPPGMYFVLGDNRRNSYDSHAWGGSCGAQTQCDFVPEENIIGQAWVSYWPWDVLGFVNNKSIDPTAP